MTSNASRRGESQQLDEIVRLLVLGIRLQVDSQAMAIQELSRAGFSPSRIADLLGTTPGTVNVALQRAKKKPARGGVEDAI